MAQEYPTLESTNFIVDTPEVLTKRTEAIRSSFSGTTAPSNPTEGQWWFKSDTEENFQYVGTEWVLDPSGALKAEVTTARGSTANLNARLSVALNDDGTIKEAVPVTANKWIEETETIEFVDATSFTVDGDLTAIYVEDRALKLTQTTSGVVYVLESTAAGSPIKTTVTVKGGVVDAGLSKVEYSTFVAENMPSNPSLLINSLTPKTTLADNDKGFLGDSEALNAKKSFSFLAVWNYIKAKMIELKILPKEMLEANTTFTVGGNRATAVSIANAGTGYVPDDILICQGGTGSPTYIKVLTVDGSGEILTAEVNRKGCYTVNPTNPVSVTGGTGSDATFNLTIEQVERDYDDLATACYDVYNKYYPKAVAGGFTTKIKCLSGYVMTNPLRLIYGIDMGWLLITSEDADVKVNPANMPTRNSAASFGCFAAGVNSTLPNFGTVFDMEKRFNSSSGRVCGVALTNNSSVVMGNGFGFINSSGENLQVYQNSRAMCDRSELYGGSEGGTSLAGVDFINYIRL